MLLDRRLLITSRLETITTLGLKISAYAAEISGWDANGSFFVENANVEHAGGGPIVCLSHRLREGTLIFAHLISSGGLTERFPSLHRAQAVQPERSGRFRVHLAALHPTGGRGK